MASHSSAVWVETVQETLEKLGQSWDEVYLDHDLGGCVWVDPACEDCGMEVVRVINELRPAHLRDTRFIVHSHNYWPALEMVKTLKAAGYKASYVPFEE